ncbi:MAG TPA: hypothetical protein VK427_17995 [Kofleriaceae bacterium]|nr:hypothetical protein [Kofleriaceae bacterium]
MTPSLSGRPQPRRELQVEIPGERSSNNKLFVGGLAAVGLIGSALGVYWHLDSRDASDEVSADAFTGDAWNEDSIALVDRANRSKTRATVAYAVGGAFLVGALVTWIVTEPTSEVAVIRTGGVAIAPTPDGGTLVTKLWSF